jgi:6-phosphogluconolactonase (cycloisomerase 2 family)
MIEGKRSLHARRLFAIVAAAVVLAFGARPAEANGCGAEGEPGAVYTQTQNPAGNEIVVYERAPNGTLTEQARVSTGGVGAASNPPFGFPILDSQGGVELTANGQLLFAVNAGDDTVSSFRVRSQGGLQLVDREPSGGDLPISLDTKGKLLYVLNELSGDVTGFRFTSAGQITKIPGSTESLSTPGPDGVAAQIGFASAGHLLTVTERGTRAIDTFRLDADDTPRPAEHSAATGQNPFGFSYRTDGTLIVANAGEAGDPADASKFHGSASSYDLTTTGELAPIDKAPARQRGTCWTVTTGDDRYAFMTNTLSASVSRFRIARSGKLTLLGQTPTGAGFPADIALTPDGRYLYVLVPSVFEGASHIDAYRVDQGTLTHIGATPSNLPPGVSGLAAR